MTNRHAAVRPWMGIVLASALLVGLVGCGDNKSSIKADPNAPIKYSVYGFVTEHLEDLAHLFLDSDNLSDFCKQGVVIGTEQDGTTFNLTGFGSFVIYVPPESGTLLIDAIWLGGDNGGYWLQSSLERTLLSYTIGPTGTTWEEGGDVNIEGPPDGKTIENLPGKEGFFGFALLGQTIVTLYLVTP